MRSVLTWCLRNLGTSLSHLHPGSGPSEALHRPPPSPHRRPPPHRCLVLWSSLLQGSLSTLPRVQAGGRSSPPVPPLLPLP